MYVLGHLKCYVEEYYMNWIISKEDPQSQIHADSWSVLGHEIDYEARSWAGVAFADVGDPEVYRLWEHIHCNWMPNEAQKYAMVLPSLELLDSISELYRNVCSYRTQ